MPTPPVAYARKWPVSLVAAAAALRGHTLDPVIAPSPARATSSAAARVPVAAPGRAPLRTPPLNMSSTGRCICPATRPVSSLLPSGASAAPRSRGAFAVRVRRRVADPPLIEPAPLLHYCGVSPARAASAAVPGLAPARLRNSAAASPRCPCTFAVRA